MKQWTCARRSGWAQSRRRLASMAGRRNTSRRRRHLTSAAPPPKKEPLRTRRADGGDRHLVLERLDHLLLHAEDLLLRVGLVRDVDQVLELRRVDLLVLAREEQRRHADELQVRPLDGRPEQVAVDEVHREVQRLGHELELEVHLDQPVDEDRAHLLVDVRLLPHVRRAHARLQLLLPEVDVPARVMAVSVMSRRRRPRSSRIESRLDTWRRCGLRRHRPRRRRDSVDESRRAAGQNRARRGGEEKPVKSGRGGAHVIHVLGDGLGVRGVPRVDIVGLALRLERLLAGERGDRVARVGDVAKDCSAGSRRHGCAFLVAGRGLVQARCERRGGGRQKKGVGAACGGGYARGRRTAGVSRPSGAL